MRRLLAMFMIPITWAGCSGSGAPAAGPDDAAADFDSSTEEGGPDGDTETDYDSGGIDTYGTDSDSTWPDSETETETEIDTETETGTETEDESGDTETETETETSTETVSDSGAGTDPGDTDTETEADSGPDVCDSPGADSRTIVCDEEVCSEYSDTYIYPPIADDGAWPWDWCHAGEPVVVGGEVVELVPALGLGQELTVWFPTASYAPENWSFHVPDYSCVRITYPPGWEVADPTSNEYLTIEVYGDCCLISLFNYSTSEHGRPYRIYVTETIGETAQEGWVFMEVKNDYDCDLDC